MEHGGSSTPRLRDRALRGGRSRVHPRPDARGRVAPDDQLRRRGPDARGRAAGRRPRRGVPRLGRAGLAGPGAAALAGAVPGPGDDHPRGGGRGHRLRLRRGPGDRPGDPRRGSARPHPRLGPAARGHAHGLRRLLRRPDAPVGRRGGVAPERGRVEHRRHDRIVDDVLARRGELPLGRLFRSRTIPAT